MTARTRDQGFSLIEVLIAVVIMGLGMIAILGALGTQVLGTRTHRSQSNAATVLVGALEAVKGTGYSVCPTSGSPDAAVYDTSARTAPLPSDWIARGWTAAQAISTSRQYWDGTGFSNTCLDHVASDTAGLLRQQQVTVTVTGPDGSRETAALVKTGPTP